MIGKALFLLMCLSSTLALYHGVDPNTLQCDPKGEEFLLLPHFTNCSKYYVCAHGREVEMSCGAGTIFDFPIQTCNHVWATECQLRGREVESGSGEEEFESVSSSPSIHSAPHAPAPPSSVEVQKANSLLNCMNPESGYRRIAYKGDCQRYWRCADGVPIAQYCSDGLFFNSYKQQCDFEANVICDEQVNDELSTEFIVYK